MSMEYLQRAHLTCVSLPCKTLHNGVHGRGAQARAQQIVASSTYCATFLQLTRGRGCTNATIIGRSVDLPIDGNTRIFTFKVFNHIKK